MMIRARLGPVGYRRDQSCHRGLVGLARFSLAVGMAVPHPHERRESPGAFAVVGDELLDSLDAVVEVHRGEQAVGRGAGDVVDPDAPAGIVDLAKQKAAGLDVRPA